MPAMTKTALSDCSYPESTVYNIRDDIDATITRLKVVIDEETSLRNALRALFVRRRENAIERVRLANLHLDLVNEEEAAFCDDLMKAAASANEGLEGSGCVGGKRTGGIAMPTFFPIPTTSLETDPSPIRVADNFRKTPVSPKTLNHGDGYDDTAPPRTPPGPTRSFDMEPLRSPANSICGLADGPPRSPARSTHAFDLPQSPARSTHAFAGEPTRTSARSTWGLSEGPTRSPARSTRGLFGEPPRSPARSTYNFAPPRSPAQSAHGKIPPRSPARSTHAFKPPGSPAQSTYRFDPHSSPDLRPYELKSPRYPALSSYGIEPPRSPARSERFVIAMVGEVPQKATETKATDAKKKKVKSKKGNAKDTNTKPAPNVLSPTDEVPPNLDGNGPISPGVDEDEESTAEDGGNKWFAATLANNKKETVLKSSPAAKRAAKTMKTNLFSMPTENLTGEPFIADFDNDPQGPCSPARSPHGLPVMTEIKLDHRALR